MTANHLPINTVPADDCRWCGNDGKPHRPACPCGERYWHIQRLGGVPYPLNPHATAAVRLIPQSSLAP